MKTARNFKDSWFYTALAVVIVIGELLAWYLSEKFGLRNNPLVVAALCAGLVAAMTMVLYDGDDIG